VTTLDHAPAEAGFVPTALAALQAKRELAGGGTGRYLLRAAMAGVIIGVLVLANYTVSAALGGAVGRLVGAAVFGLALTFIYFSRSELTTSTMMVACVGVYYRRMRAWAALRLMGLCLLGNALGGLVVALMVRFSSVLSGPTLELAGHSVQTKLGYLAAGAAGYGDLFVRAIGCNLLINLAMLLVYKGTMHSEGGKIAVLWSGVFLFVVLGFEHSVANTVLFLMYGLSHGIDLLAAVVAVAIAFAGNLVGGGLLVGATYAWLNDRRREVTG
jgi:formate/nitrite transporter FocA (FNT family)